MAMSVNVRRLLATARRRPTSRATGVRIAAGLLAFALVGCSSTCETGSCLPHGTYIDPNAALGATSAEICYDDECTTVTPTNDSSDNFLTFDTQRWDEGRTMKLRLTVFDANHGIIDSLTERRTMDSSRCACGVLYYVWKNGHLQRLN
jgi:hypothetical protein